MNYKPLIAHDHVSTKAFKQEFQLEEHRLKQLIANFKNSEVQLSLYQKDQPGSKPKKSSLPDINQNNRQTDKNSEPATQGMNKPE